MTLPGEPFGEFEFGLSNVPPGPLPGCVVDLDVDEDHDAAGDVEGTEGAVHHVTAVVAQLQNKLKTIITSFPFTLHKNRTKVSCPRLLKKLAPIGNGNSDFENKKIKTNKIVSGLGKN